MEDYIDRPRYIDRIRPFVDVPVIKILTGVRRCGKSTLLDMIAERISERFPRAPVVRLNLESEAGLALRDPAALLEHLRARLPDRSQRAYVFLDEVQRVPGWEDAVNALRVDWNCDLYLTGSNSTMLAGELATNLAGRYVEFPVLPLVFREFIELHAGTARAPRELFDDYLVLGGFPALKYFGLSAPRRSSTSSRFSTRSSSATSSSTIRSATSISSAVSSATASATSAGPSRRAQSCVTSRARGGPSAWTPS